LDITLGVGLGLEVMILSAFILEFKLPNHYYMVSLFAMILFKIILTMLLGFMVSHDFV
jgi:hypothetical protein